MPAKKVIKSFNNYYNLTFKLNNNEIVLFLNIFKLLFSLEIRQWEQLIYCTRAQSTFDLLNYFFVQQDNF